jgi:hypothetical protein
MKEHKINPEDIHLLKVSVFKSSIERQEKLLDQPLIEPKNYSFSFAQKSAFNHEEGMVRIQLFILLKAQGDNASDLGIQGEFGIEFNYKIDNIETLYTKGEDGKLHYDVSLGATLMSISYSTARGIILQQTQGSIISLSGVIMPVINPADLLKAPLES